MYHQPILLEAFLSFFEHQHIKVYVDGTIGAGGHAKALLMHHPEIECFYAFDKDPLALEIAKETLKEFETKVKFIHEDYRNIASSIEHEKVDGIFFDLGVSSMQLDRPEKGFSFSKEGPLDMRMDPYQHLSAEVVVNTFSEKKLGEIFREYGEEPRWKKAAKAIVEGRKKKKISSTLDLHVVLKPVLTWGGRRGKVHPMTLIFQALRIYVNDELKGLEEALPKAISLLAPGGRMGVIAFHSLEDRIVKENFKHHVGQVKILTKKPLIADSAEVKKNPRSRSAKMRFIEKIT